VEQPRSGESRRERGERQVSVKLLGLKRAEATDSGATSAMRFGKSHARRRSSSSFRGSLRRRRSPLLLSRPMRIPWGSRGFSRPSRCYLDLKQGEEPHLVCALAVAVSKALTHEGPLWLILNGPPGRGKTEAISLLKSVADGRVDELTRAGLLSWSDGREVEASRAPDENVPDRACGDLRLLNRGLHR
jgi:hypothetical protein